MAVATRALGAGTVSTVDVTHKPFVFMRATVGEDSKNDRLKNLSQFWT